MALLEFRHVLFGPGNKAAGISDLSARHPFGRIVIDQARTDAEFEEVLQRSQHIALRKGRRLVLQREEIGEWRWS